MFRVLEIDPNAPEGAEALGTKRAFWFHHPDLRKCWFKQSRPGTGEDWAEKVAAEVAEQIGLPHARYELATWMGLRGTVSPSFVPESGTLVHGNELLLRLDPAYRAGSRYKVSRHTVDLVLDAVRESRARMPWDWDPPSGIGSAEEVFVGYVLLDALIGNTDRHHENWGVIERPEAHEVIGYLAPTFDHASSLGRNESDVNRRRRLSAQDSGDTVRAYARRARSALYLDSAVTRPLTTFDAWCHAAQRNLRARRIWLDRLERVSAGNLDILLQELPSERISQTAAIFARELMLANRKRLLEETPQ